MLHERKMEKKNMINLLHKTIKIFKKKPLLIIGLVKVTMIYIMILLTFSLKFTKP